jgi:hypothetical protein
MSRSNEEECRLWISSAIEKIERLRLSRHHASALNEFAWQGPHSATACECKKDGILTLKVGEIGYIYKWQHENLRLYNTWWIQDLVRIGALDYMRNLVEADLKKGREGQEPWLAPAYAEDLVKFFFTRPPSAKWVLPGQMP